MEIQFEKYEGAGNDFILIDNRDHFFREEQNVIAQLCHRRFGIGADGLILLENSEQSDFSMRYFNSDGNESTMCGNGGRCIVAFARKKEIIHTSTRFMASDGLHEATINPDNTISLQMQSVKKIQHIGDDFFLDTGSPHYVRFVEKLSQLDVHQEGRKIRYNRDISKEGTNVNFVKIEKDNSLSIRTYERGVEDETLACGTGSVASALAAFLRLKTNQWTFTIHARGGLLRVSFKHDSENNNFQDIWLTGPANHVFNGSITI